MENNIKRYCKNYKTIINCEFLDDDLFSKKLVNYYKNAINRLNFSDSNSINKISKYDRVMRKYIEDYNFSKKLRNSIDITSILNSGIDLTEPVLEYVAEFSSKYDENIEEPIVNTRWI